MAYDIQRLMAQFQPSYMRQSLGEYANPDGIAQAAGLLPPLGGPGGIAQGGGASLGLGSLINPGGIAQPAGLPPSLGGFVNPGGVAQEGGLAQPYLGQLTMARHRAPLPVQDYPARPPRTIHQAPPPAVTWQAPQRPHRQPLPTIDYPEIKRGPPRAPGGSRGGY